MITEGKCAFSGHIIQKGKGRYRICSDGRPLLLKNRKVNKYIENKVNSTRIKWTSSSRQFYKKDSNIQKEKREKIQLPKIIRGFPSLNIKAVEGMRERNKSVEKKDYKKSEKISKKANVFTKK